MGSIRKKWTGIIKCVGAAHKRVFSNETDNFPCAVERVLSIAIYMINSANRLAVTDFFNLLPVLDGYLDDKNSSEDYIFEFHGGKNTNSGSCSRKMYPM